MNHPNRISFSGNITASPGCIHGRWYSVELIDLMSMMDKDEGLPFAERHKYVAYGFHSGTVLFVGIVYFTQYIKDNELRLRCLNRVCQQLLTLKGKDVYLRRIIFRVEEVEVVWEADTGGYEASQTFSPNGLTGVELEVESTGRCTIPVQEPVPRGDSVSHL